MSESSKQEVSSTVNPPDFLTSYWKRGLYAAFMAIMALLDFLFVEFLTPDWQSGRSQDYIALFLSHRASLLVFPLILYSFVCFVLFMDDQEKYLGMFIVRFGIYTGAFLALQYSLLTILLTYNTSKSSTLLLILVYVSPLILKIVGQWISRKVSPVLIRNILIGIILVGMLVVMIVSGDVTAPFFAPLVFVGFGAPFWSFLISGQTALWLLKNYESNLTILRGFGIATWVAAYIGALRFDILKMYELYAALPTEPPDCYIATAAANGHSRFVRSRTVHLRNGSLMQINSQLQHFKSVEIALMAAFPKIHYFIRKIYDVVGKNLAAYIQNPLLADVAFLILLPVEWVSFHILKLFVPEIEMIAKKIYHS